MRLLLRSLLFTLFAIAFTSVNVYSQSATSSATITTDQPDYAPGSTVFITGTGWQPAETVTLQVLHVGDTGDNATSGVHAPFTTVADANGNVSSTWSVPLDLDELGATLLLTADGAISGRYAETTFTDANNIKFAVSGLPNGASVTVTGISYTGNGSTIVTNASETFNASGTSSNIGVASGSITFNFPQTVTYLGVTYQLASISNTSPFTPPNGNTTITGAYTACTAPAISSATNLTANSATSVMSLIN